MEYVRCSRRKKIQNKKQNKNTLKKRRRGRRGRGGIPYEGSKQRAGPVVEGNLVGDIPPCDRL